MTWTDPARNIVWSNIVPLGARVVAGTPQPLTGGTILGRKARTLAEVYRIDPLRQPFAGKPK
jgi:hypothetical protein